MKSLAEGDLWRELDKVFEAFTFKESVTHIEKVISVDTALGELAKSARTLMELNFKNSKRKAAGYAVLAASAYVRQSRLAPATAIVKNLKAANYPLEVLAHLEALVSNTFSSHDTLIERFDSHDKFANKRETPKEKSYQIQTPLFSKLTAEESKAVLQVAKIKKLKQGEVLFKEGDAPSGFYIIAEGEMYLTSTAGYRATLKENDFFGEIAMISGQKRTATLTAKNEVELLEFSKADLIDCFVKFSKLEERFMQFYTRRLFFYIAKQHPLLKDLDSEDLEHFLYFFRPARKVNNEVLISQFQVPSKLFFLIHGEVDVAINGNRVAGLKPGEFVGEIGLLEAKPSTATVICKQICDVLECDDFLLPQLCAQFPQVQEWLKKMISDRLALNTQVFD